MTHRLVESGETSEKPESGKGAGGQYEAEVGLLESRTCAGQLTVAEVVTLSRPGEKVKPSNDLCWIIGWL